MVYLPHTLGTMASQWNLYFMWPEPVHSQLIIISRETGFKIRTAESCVPGMLISYQTASIDLVYVDELMKKSSFSENLSTWLGNQGKF